MQHDLDQYRGCTANLDKLIQYATDLTMEEISAAAAKKGMEVTGLHTDKFMSPKAIGLHVDSEMLVVKFDWKTARQTGWMSYVVKFNARGKLVGKLMSA